MGDLFPSLVVVKMRLWSEGFGRRDGGGSLFQVIGFCGGKVFSGVFFRNWWEWESNRKAPALSLIPLG